MRAALLPGSFDPVTNGHLDLARRVAALFDCVYVVAMRNDKKQYLFPREERLALLREVMQDVPGVVVDEWDGMLWEYARDKGVCAIVKGVRSSADWEYELLQARFNRAAWPATETLLLLARDDLAFVSSTELKRRAAQGLELESLAPEAVRRALLKKLNGEK